MRKIVAYELVSIDGVGEEPSQFVETFDDQMRDNLQRVIATQDLVLLGRRTYDEWASFWPTSSIEPFASFINAVDKCVVTSSVPETGFGPTRSIGPGPDLLAEIDALKQGDGGDIGLHGSLTLFSALLAGNVIDELRLVVAPALAGSGRRLFDQRARGRLRLLRSVATPSGALLADFATVG